MENESLDAVLAELNAAVFMAHVEALVKLGLWDTFLAQNRDLVEQLSEKLTP